MNTAAPAKFSVILMGRQSYDLDTQELKMTPDIDRLIKVGSNSIVDTFELYSHMLDLAEGLNDQISSKIDDYNVLIEESNSENEDEATVVDTSDPKIDFASVFDVEENTALTVVEKVLRDGGYSSVSVYIEVRSSDPDGTFVYLTPTEISELNSYV